MRKYLTLLLPISLWVCSCTQEPEPDPIPDEIRAYVTLYNFIYEPFNVKWVVDEGEDLESSSYGNTLFGGVILGEESEDISFVVKNGSTGEFIESQLLHMTENKYYIAIIFGSEENPVLLCQELETSRPASGNVKLQFLHATESLDSLDLYIGGTSSEKQLLSGLAYGDFSEYSEVLESEVRALVTVALHDSIYHQDNELLSFKYNDHIKINSNNLIIIAPSTHTPPSELTLWLYEQAKD